MALLSHRVEGKWGQARSEEGTRVTEVVWQVLHTCVPAVEGSGAACSQPGACHSKGGAGKEDEQQGLHPVLTWDAGTAGGGLTCTTRLALPFRFFLLAL